jgi:lipoyl(octanoyl) transferase
MEEALIKTLEHFDINAARLSGATGVWIEGNSSKARKICAIGVRASRFVTMHGFALNVNTDLTYFNHINPCGFVDKGVTSMQKELGKLIDMEEVKRVFMNNFSC